MQVLTDKGIVGSTDHSISKVDDVFAHTGAIARTSAYYGQGIGPILLSGVRCTGFETSLFDCPHAGIETSNCGHSLDAGVKCLEGK